MSPVPTTPPIAERLPPSGRRKRADAVRNRAAVVAAAGCVFRDKGLDAGIPEIAERAGVGKGTVYRSFATKDHLIAAVVVERLAEYEARFAAACAQDDAWEALRSAVLAKSPDPTFHESLRRVIDVPEVREARAANLAALGALVRRAQEQGRMRGDVAPEDLAVVFAGLAAVLAASPDATPAVWRRYLTLALDGFGADGARALSGRPLSRPSTRERPHSVLPPPEAPSRGRP